MWYSALIRSNDQVGQIHQEFRLTPGQPAALIARVREIYINQLLMFVSVTITFPTQKIIHPFTLQANGQNIPYRSTPDI